MIDLNAILAQYREGERSLPTYAELAQFVGQDESECYVSPAPHEPTEAA
jgi:hypothetical protein